jgi:hypothetical protein
MKNAAILMLLLLGASGMFFFIDWIIKNFQIGKSQNILIGAALLIVIIVFFSLFDFSGSYPLLDWEDRARR